MSVLDAKNPLLKYCSSILLLTSMQCISAQSAAAQIDHQAKQSIKKELKAERKKIKAALPPSDAQFHINTNLAPLRNMIAAMDFSYRIAGESWSNLALGGFVEAGLPDEDLFMHGGATAGWYLNRITESSLYAQARMGYFLMQNDADACSSSKAHGLTAAAIAGYQYYFSTSAFSLGGATGFQGAPFGISTESECSVAEFSETATDNDRAIGPIFKMNLGYRF